jgi:hypothetical protein
MIIAQKPLLQLPGAAQDGGFMGQIRTSVAFWEGKRRFHHQNDATVASDRQFAPELLFVYQGIDQSGKESFR